MKEGLRMPVAGVVLAGGKNRRMNAPKAFIEVGGERIIDRELRALGLVFEELVIAGGEPGDYPGLGARAVPDDRAFSHVKSPLTGIYTGLKAAKSPCSFVVGCDMPFINPDLAAWIAGRLEGHDAVVPVSGGYAEPLFGAYSKTAAGVIEAALLEGVRRVSEVFGRMDVLYVPEEELRRFDPELLSLFNVNTPEDLARARDIAGMKSVAAV
jgi:molybdopterin-guanine dinucleotide biosynthesis protein A